MKKKGISIFNMSDLIRNIKNQIALEDGEENDN